MTLNHTTILAYEEQSAKNVALLIRASRRRPGWHFFVPFKFVFEIAAAKREIHWFAQDFLHPRKLALNAARDIVAGEDPQERLREASAGIRDWLASHTSYSDELHRKQTELVELLAAHYVRLLRAEGGDYAALVRNAYLSRAEYESFLYKLAAAENEVDRTVVALKGQTAELQSQILVKQRALATVRAKDTQGFFRK